MATASTATSPGWPVRPFGSCSRSACSSASPGCHTLVAHQRIGASLDAYQAQYYAHRSPIDGTTQAVAFGVFGACLGATLAIVGLFFGIVGLVQTMR